MSITQDGEQLKWEAAATELPCPSPAHERLRSALFLFVLASYVVTLALSAHAGLRIDYVTTSRLTFYVAAPLIAGIFYFQRRGMGAVVTLVETQLCGLALTVPVGLATYLAMRAGHPLADETLASMDSAIGFDWTKFIAWVDRSPWITQPLGLAYSSFAMQLMIMPVVLFLYGQGARSYRMIISYGLICFVASLISVWFPAMAAYAHYAVDPAILKNLNPHFGYDFMDQFVAVRADPHFVFSPETMKGILTFPSVHAAVAVLCAWASWQTGSLRYPFLILNGLMAVSAISHGGHYLVDVLAGVLVAGVVIAATSSLDRSAAHQ